jgi:hypothetical protein
MDQKDALEIAYETQYKRERERKAALEKECMSLKIELNYTLSLLNQCVFNLNRKGDAMTRCGFTKQAASDKQLVERIGALLSYKDAWIRMDGDDEE